MSSSSSIYSTSHGSSSSVSPLVRAQSDGRLSPARMPRRSADDTLPSPPATQPFPLTASEVGASWLNQLSLADDGASPAWMLHETATEDEDEGKDEAAATMTGTRGTSQADLAHAEHQIGNNELITASALRVGTSSSASASVHEREHVNAPSQHRCSSTVDACAPDSMSSAAGAVAEHHLENDSATSSSESTTVIDVPSHHASDITVCVPPPPPTVPDADAAQLAVRSRRRPVLVSPAMTDDSTDTSSWMSPGRADAADFRSRGSVESRRVADKLEGEGDSRGGSYSARDALYHRGSMEARREQSYRGPPALPVRLSRERASPSLGTDLSPSPQRVSSTHVSPARLSEPPEEAASVNNGHRVGREGQTEGEFSPTMKGTVQRLRLQLNQAERAAALQQALHEAAVAEKDDLQVQLEELLRIHGELERRMQQGEAALSDAAQRHASERLRWETEKQREHEHITSTRDALLHQREGEVAALRKQLLEADNRVHALQSEVTGVREELLTLMEEHLEVKQALSESQRAQAEASQLCRSLTAKAAARAVEEEQVASRQVKHTEVLLAAMRDVEERAAVSALAFRTLCDQLDDLVEHGSLFLSSCEAFDVSSAGRASFVGAEGEKSRTSSGDKSAVYSFIERARSAVAERMTEENVAAAMKSAVAQQSVRLQLPAPAQSSHGSPSEAPGSAENVSRPPPSIHTEVGTMLLEKQFTENECVSEVCRASLLHYRQEVQNVVNRVSDTCRRMVRETRAAADARAADMERVLSTELRQLRAQLEASQRPGVPTGRPHRENRSVNTELNEHDNKRGEESCATPPAGNYSLSEGTKINPDLGMRNVAPTSATFITPEARALQSTLAETTRALQLERQHTALLTKDVEAMQEAHYTATLLAQVEATVKDVEVSVAQLVRDAVEEIRAVHVACGNRESQSADEGNDYRSTVDSARRFSFAGVNERGSTESPRWSRTGASATSSVSERRALMDPAVLRSIQKAVLLAETQVERVGGKLLSETRHYRCADSFADESPERCRSAVYKDAVRAPPTTSRHVSSAVTFTSPTNSKSVNRKGSTALASPRSTRQQLVYEEMQGLLHRSREEVSGDVLGGGRSGSTRTPSSPPGALITRYSPDGSRWLVGIRPPPRHPPSELPSGTVLTPARGLTAAPSPYVHAYVRSLDASRAVAPSIGSTPQHASYPVRTATATPGTLSAAVAVQLFEGMSTTAQELRNVGRLLELLQDSEELREERQQECLQRWEARITEAVAAHLRKVTGRLTSMRPSNTALALYSRQRSEWHGADPLLRILPTTSQPSAGDMSQRRTPHVSLADVLAGKTAYEGSSTKVRSPAAAAAPATATRAVLYAVPEVN